MHNGMSIRFALSMLILFCTFAVSKTLPLKVKNDIIGGINSFCAVACNFASINGYSVIGKVDNNVAVFIFVFRHFRSGTASGKKKHYRYKTGKYFFHDYTSYLICY